MSEVADPRGLAARLLAASPRALPLAEVHEHIRQRRKQLLQSDPPPSTDFSQPEAAPIVNNPDAFAAGFWQRMKAKDTRPGKTPGKKSKSKPRHPKARPSKRPSPFSVIDGGRED